MDASHDHDDAAINAMAQALYNAMKTKIDDMLGLNGGGNAVICALAVLLGQVYDFAPEHVQDDIREIVLDQLGMDAPNALPDLPAQLERTKAPKPKVH